MTTHADDRGLSMLSLGDSYTIGECVAADQRWPVQLISRLRAEGRHMQDVDILAATGWTTDELLAAAGHHAFKAPYALVSLLIGVNNQYRERSLESYSAEFSRLLEFAVEQAGGVVERVMVVSIPDWGVTAFAAEKGVDTTAVAAEIDRFNACARELASRRGAHWTDITELSRGAGRNLLADDGLHPSAEQYTLWMERILPLARRLLDTISRDSG